MNFDVFERFSDVFGRFSEISGHFRTFPDVSDCFQIIPKHFRAFSERCGAVKVPKNRTKVDEHFLFRRKMKCRGSSETRFGPSFVSIGADFEG